MATLVTFRGRKVVRYADIEALKKEFVCRLRKLFTEEGLDNRYTFFVTESRGTSLYCYVADRENGTGGMFRVSDHRTTVFDSDIDYGTIYYNEHKNLKDVVSTVFSLILKKGILHEQVQLTLEEYKVLEYLLYLNLVGYKVTVNVDRKGVVTNLVDYGLDSVYVGSTIHYKNFIDYVGLTKLMVGNVERCREDLDFACKTRFYELVNLGTLSSLIDKGVINLFQERDTKGTSSGLVKEVYKLNLNAKGLYYISNISLGVDVLRGITLSTWFNKYSIDLLVGSSTWVSRDRLGEVSWR